MRLLLAIAALLFAPTAASAATITVPPGGNLTTAYNQAQSGDTIQLQAGNYGQWVVPSGSKAVTVKGVAGTKFTKVDVAASNLTLDTVDIDGGGQKINTLSTGGNAANFQMVNSRVGNNIDEKGVLLGDSSGAVFDNVVFHDSIMTTQGENAGVHMECVYSFQATLTIKNSRFTNCAVMDLFLTRGSWFGQPGYGGFTFLNNVFEASRRTNGQGTHFYGLYFADVGATWKQGVAESSTVDRAVIRGNTFGNMAVAAEGKFTNSVESCNTGPMDFPRIVHEACGSPTPTPTPSPTPSPTPTPTPTPEPGYTPACKPTCDEQITQLRADVEAQKATLAEITASRDAWQARALEAERLVANLPRIRELVAELDAALD